MFRPPASHIRFHGQKKRKLCMDKFDTSSRLDELHDSQLSFVSRIECIRSKLTLFSARVTGVPAAGRRL